MAWLLKGIGRRLQGYGENAVEAHDNGKSNNHEACPKRPVMMNPVFTRQSTHPYANERAYEGSPGKNGVPYHCRRSRVRDSSRELARHDRHSEKNGEVPDEPNESHRLPRLRYDPTATTAETGRERAPLQLYDAFYLVANLPFPPSCPIFA
jgi:hypothetical protein